MLGVRDTVNSSAHLSGATEKDVVLMYALMNSNKVGEGKMVTTTTEFQSDIRTAIKDGKSLILVLRREYI